MGDNDVHEEQNGSTARSADPISQLHQMCLVRKWGTPKFEFNVKCHVRVDHNTVFWSEGNILIQRRCDNM